MHLPEAGGLITFLAELMRLKSTPRIGWLLRGVRDVESVAAHSFGVAVIAMLLADRARARGVEVNVERLLRMALLHDLTETRTAICRARLKLFRQGFDQGRRRGHRQRYLRRTGRSE